MAVNRRISSHPSFDVSALRTRCTLSQIIKRDDWRLLLITARFCLNPCITLVDTRIRLYLVHVQTRHPGHAVNHPNALQALHSSCTERPVMSARADNNLSLHHVGIHTALGVMVLGHQRPVGDNSTDLQTIEKGLRTEIHKIEAEASVTESGEHCCGK